MEVANTIYRQLGGDRLKLMIGCNRLVAHKDGLGFGWPSRQPSRGNYCRVTLLPTDTYRVEFMSVRGTTVKTVRTFEDIYCDQLMDIFEEQTGLYLTLSPRR